jgi:hypothetical protein
MYSKHKPGEVLCTFDLVCPKKWEELELNREGVRYCDNCYSDVFLCETVEEVQLAKALKKCIAIAPFGRVKFMGDAQLLPDLSEQVEELFKDADDLFAKSKGQKTRGSSS